MSQKPIENQYLKFYKNHSVKELEKVVGQPDLYENEARLAAYEVLITKSENLSEQGEIEFKKLKSDFNLKQQVSLIEKEDEVIEVLEWYSPFAILGFTLFCSPFFGAILLSYNLRKASKKREAIYVLIIGVFFLLLTGALMHFQKMTQMKSLIISIASGLIFIELFWKKYLGYKTDFKRKPIWKMLGIVLGIVVVLTAIQLHFNPQLLQEMIEAQSK